MISVDEEKDNKRIFIMKVLVWLINLDASGTDLCRKHLISG